MVPSAYVASTSASFPLVVGAKEQYADSMAPLSAGTTYWLGIVVNVDTTITARPDSGQVGQKHSQNFTAGWPATGSAGAAISPASDLAIYIQTPDPTSPNRPHY